VSHISFGVDNLKFGDVAQFQHFQHVLGLNINFNSVDIQDGGLWDVVVSSLTLFLLQFDGNTSYSLVLKTFHQMGDETSDLVSEGFAGDDGNFLADTFVDMVRRHNNRRGGHATGTRHIVFPGAAESGGRRAGRRGDSIHTVRQPPGQRAPRHRALVAPPPGFGREDDALPAVERRGGGREMERDQREDRSQREGVPSLPQSKTLFFTRPGT